MGKSIFLKKRIRNILKPILKNPKNQKIVEKNILKKKAKKQQINRQQSDKEKK